MSVPASSFASVQSPLAEGSRRRREGRREGGGRFGGSGGVHGERFSVHRRTGRLAERDALLQQAQTLTLQIRADRTALESSLTTESIYVDGVVEKLPADAQAAAIKSAGMGVAADTGTPVGPMPKVEGLTASAGDADREIDLHWNAIRRGLQNFRIELSEDPAGQSGWRFAANSRKSSATIEGLTSGKRSWFRVTAEGAAGPGPASTPATKVAP